MKTREIAFFYQNTLNSVGFLIINKGVLAIISSNSFSHIKVDQKKTVAFSEMFIHVQLHTYITPTVQILLYCDQDRCVNAVVQPWKCGLYFVQYSVFRTKFVHKFLLPLSTQPDYV